MQPDEAKVTQHRTIVVGLVWNRRRELLLCKMTEGRGVFPGQWGFPGGGIEPGEQMTDALHRELSEELGIEIDNPVPALFKDCLHSKTFATGSVRMVYMVFLLFHCVAASESICLNEEFEEYRWVSESDLEALELNAETIDTLSRLGPWSEIGYVAQLGLTV